MHTYRKLLVLGLLSIGIKTKAQDLITTIGGTYGTNYNNLSLASEDSSKFIDNSITTKWFLNRPAHFNAFPILARFKFNTTTTVAQYTITSANDAADRDPKSWTLEASNDGASWTTVDTRNNETFPNRQQTRIFDLAAPASWLYYRLNITATVGTAHFQCAEWRLLGVSIPDATPSNLSAFATSGAEIFLSWTDNSTNESSFVIERSTDGITYTPIGSVAGNTTSYTDGNGLLVNTLYYYRIKGQNNTGSSPYIMATATTLNQSGAVTDVTDDGGNLFVLVENSGGATANEGSPKLIDNNYTTKYLAFGSVPAGGYWLLYKAKMSYIVTGYTITTANDAAGRDAKTWQFQGSNDSTNWNVLDSRTNISTPLRGTKFKYNFSNTVAYTYYRLLVTANNGATDGVMTQIGEWEIWGINAAAPKVPSSLATNSVTFNTIGLTWTDNSNNESGFQIERSEDNSTFSAVGTAATNATSYTDANLYGGTQYWYRIRALSSTAGMSVPSNVVTATTLWDPALPFSPRNLTATTVSDAEIALTWDDRSANEAGFRIERSTDGVAFTQIGAVGADVTTYSSTGLTKASRYYYRVIAFNSAGTSYYSNIANAITQGVNAAPTFSIVRDTVACSKAFAYKILVTGVAAGPAVESYQKITMGAVASKPALFSTLSFSTVSNDSAVLTFQTVGDLKDSAIITVTATDDGGTFNSGANTFTRTFKIVYNPLTIAVTSQEGITIAPYQTAHLTAFGDRVTDYRWTDTTGIVSGSLTTNKLEVKPTYHTRYTVTGNNNVGCSASASIIIGFGGNVLPNVVNVITPNGDGKNDKWVIWNINRYTDNEVRVFDKAGRQVFYKKNYGNDWDGTYNGRPLDEGAYLYVITLGPGIHPLKGTVVIVRDHK